MHLLLIGVHKLSLRLRHQFENVPEVISKRQSFLEEDAPIPPTLP